MKASASQTHSAPRSIAIKSRKIFQSSTVRFPHPSVQITSYRFYSTTPGQKPRDMLVLYGSQTGSAENIANEIAAESSRRGIKTHVMSMAEFQMERMDSLPEQKVVTYVVSTIGNGEFPDNAANFYKTLTEPSLAEKQWLKGTNYTIFGLGYAGTHNNEAAKNLDAQLTALGAKPFHSVFYSDEYATDGHDMALLPWMEGLWKQLGAADFQSTLTPMYSVFVHDPDTPLPSTVPLGYKNVTVRSTKMLTPTGYDHPVMEIILDTSGSSVSFGLGDQVMILPRNPPDRVIEFVKYVNLDLETIVSLNPLPGASRLKIPEILTIGELFSHHLDLSGAPSRKLIGYMAQLAHDKMEAADLDIIAQSSEKHQKLVQSMVSTAEFMMRYPSIVGKCSLDILVTILPTMKPRSYSIACAPVMHSTQIRMIIAIPLRDKFVGLCSGYLAELKAGSKIPIATAGSLHHPIDPQKPLLLFALGTGIGSMMAILENRLFQIKSGRKVGPCHLYFSVRHKQTDYILADELEELQREGVITKLETIFSHDSVKPVFIVDRIIHNQSEIFYLLEKGAYVHYCGVGGQVPVLIEDAIKKSIETGSLVASAQAQLYIERMKRSERWTVESFGTSLLDDSAGTAERMVWTR